MSQAGILDDSGGSIDPSIPTQFNGNTGSAVPAFNQLNVVGDNTQGINVTGAGSTLTITGINASYTQKGVASFDIGDFTVTNGNVEINASAVGVLSVTAGANINLTGTATNPIINLNTQILEPDGAVGAPPYSFTLHPDSGMYWDGRLSFSANGVKVVYFDQFNWASDASNNTFNGGLNINSYLAPNYTNPGGYPYSVLSTDYYISVDSSGGARTINFPNAPRTNVEYVVKDRTGNAGTNNITLTTPAGTILFDGSATYVIDVNFGAVHLKFNGTNFEVF